MRYLYKSYKKGQETYVGQPRPITRYQTRQLPHWGLHIPIIFVIMEEIEKDFLLKNKLSMYKKNCLFLCH